MYRLVVIDDEYIVVEGIKAMIARKKLEYEVVGCAYDGIHGLEVIRETKPDLVITDIRIPGMDGLSMIEAAKEFCEDTVFVVISGYTEFEYARRALRLGVKGYIDKPISIDKLNDVLNAVEKECFQTKEEQYLLAMSRQLTKELNAITENSIKSLVEKDAGAFSGYANKALEKLNLLYPQLLDLKREVYKYLSVLCDILLESKKGIDRENLISFHEMESRKSKDDVFQYAKSIILDLEKYLEADKIKSGHGTILELLTYIEAHYNEDIGLNELADMVKMNTAYLSVLFKSEVGMSYVKFLTSLRIDKAKNLLKKGYKVYKVSEMVGYNNYRYFTDIFKKYTGETPKNYQNHVYHQDVE